MASFIVEIQSTHLQAKLIKRSKDKSAVAAAAYRSGQKLIDERAEKTFDFTRRQQVHAVRILTPSDAPDWAHDRARLWNEVEASEKRKDAQLAREIVLSLPHSLPAETRAELVWNFAADNFVAHGMIADIALHGPGIGDPRNFHAHIMLTMRDISPDGFGKKNRDWNANAMLEGWKIAWEATCNAALETASINIRVDRRSIADRHQAAMDAAEAASDPTEKNQLEIEAERLNYIPRPHLPPRIYRAMIKDDPIPPLWVEPIAQWKAAQKSRAEAQLRAKKMQAAHNAKIAARDAENARQIEDQILKSRNRVLRGRVARNTAKGVWQNLREGRNALQPFHVSIVKAATDRFLAAAQSLLKIWNDFRTGLNNGDFRNTENEYIEAGEDLAKMHLVLEAPEKLSGFELLQERDRLGRLEKFEDQTLIAAVMTGSTDRLAKITEYIRSPAGTEKVNPVLTQIKIQKKQRTEQDKREAKRKAQDEANARKEQRSKKVEQEKAAKRAREADIVRRTEIVERARIDQPVRTILRKNGIKLNRPVDVIARDNAWDEFRSGKRNTLSWYGIDQEIEALDAERALERRALAKKKPQTQSTPEPKPEKPAPQQKKPPKPYDPGNDFSP